MSQINEQIRDSHGQWQPETLPSPSSIYSWPPKFLTILKGLGREFFHWRNLFYILVGVISWLFLTPDLSRTSTFSIDWISEIYLRNCAFLNLLRHIINLCIYFLYRIFIYVKSCTYYRHNRAGRFISC